MNALSIRQPWAWLIAHGHKDIENRTWRTDRRGRFLIHASKTFDDAGYAWVKRQMPHIALPAKINFRKGGIVGEASLIGCVTQHDSVWFFGPVGFLLRDAKPLPFYPQCGRLSFFECNYEYSLPRNELLLHAQQA